MVTQIYHKRLCSENVVISAGFFLKLTGVECDTPMLHRNTSTALLKRTPTVSGEGGEGRREGGGE